MLQGSRGHTGQVRRGSGFPGLYGTFGGVATVSVGRYSLESNVVFAEG